MEQELAAAKHEICTLKGKLKEKQDAVHGMEMDMNFHALKAQELEGILAETRPDEFQQKLQLKAVQNAGLTVQVQELRRQLDEASFQRHNADMELTKAMDKIQRLTDERKSHHKMLVEMSDVVRMLGQIDIDYTKVNEEPSSWTIHDKTLDNIKRKIHAMEHDRQSRIEENHELQTELFEKAIELDSYKNQATLLETMNEDRDRLEREKESLQEALTTKDILIKSLEQSLASLTRKPNAIPKNVVYEHFSIYKQGEEPDMEAVLQGDGSTVVVPSTESVSRMTSKLPEDDTFSLSSLESPEAASRTLPGPSGDKPNCDIERLESEMEKLKTELEATRVQVKATKKKQGLRNKLLRDVISQYKQLQKEHDIATAQLAKMARMESSISSHRSLQGTRNGKANEDAQKRTQEGLLEESPTFETAESFGGVTAESSPSLAATTTSTMSSSINALETDLPVPTFTEAEYRQLENEYTRLEDEYDGVMTRVSNLEEDLTKTKEDLSNALSKNLEKQNELLELQEMYDYLEADHKAVTEKTLQLSEDLQFAQEQANQARKKRDQREHDLWDVIDQYKKLAEENEHTLDKMQGVENQLDQTQALMASVEHELALTKRHTKRNDLIYDKIRMEQQLEDYKIQIDELERNLKVARSDAVRSKEDSKSLRNRLAGCNFHFKQLQAQHEDVVTKKVSIERDLEKTRRPLKLREAQLQPWKGKVSNVREQKAEAPIQNKHLIHENTELKSDYNESLRPVE